MEAIRYYVKGAFVGVAETPEVLEQQEELISDLTAKVADLVAEGKTEDEALGIAIASMGDLSGLVREFVTEEAPPVPPAPAVPQPATAEVYIRRLRLHTDIVAVGGALAVLFVLSVLAVMSGSIDAAAGVWDLLFGIAAVVIMGYSLVRFHEQPNAVETIVVPDGAVLRKSLLTWVAVCGGAVILNMGLNSQDFWAWTAWVAAAAWPARVWVERWFVENGRFVAMEVERAPEVGDASSLASA